MLRKQVIVQFLPLGAVIMGTSFKRKTAYKMLEMRILFASLTVIGGWQARKKSALFTPEGAT